MIAILTGPKLFWISFFYCCTNFICLSGKEKSIENQQLIIIIQRNQILIYCYQHE